MVTQVRDQVADENWGLMAVRGVLVMLLGLTVLVWPGPSIASLVVLLGTILLVDGIAALIYAASGGRSAEGNAWPLVMAGLVGVGAAVITYVWPQITVGTILFIIAFWAIARGVLEIAAYVELRDTFKSSWLLAVSGARRARAYLWPYFAGLAGCGIASPRLDRRGLRHPRWRGLFGAGFSHASIA